MVLDKITETIAHFIGLFEITAEEARVREHYRKFEAAAPEAQEAAPIETRGVVIRSPHEFDGFDPYIPYTPAPPLPVSGWTALGLVDRRFDIDLSAPATAWADGGHRLAPKDIGSGSVGLRLPQLDPPGSVAVIVAQSAVMSDDDTIVFGGHGLSPQAMLDPAAALEALLSRAEALSLGTDAARPGSGEEIRQFIVAQRDALKAVHVAPDGAEIAVQAGDRLDGLYVNGSRVEEAPRFADHRPDHDEADAGPFPDGWQPSMPDRILGQSLGESLAGGAPVSAGSSSSIDLTAGGNTLVNSVVLKSSWLAATVTAIVGDHVELNAIVQANVWSDLDRLTAAIGGGGDDVATLGFNIAGFERIDPADGAEAAGAGEFPDFWVVTQITGDLMILNWIEQMTFMTDNDLAILSASGSHAEIVAGANGARNSVSLLELGHSYDLIVVGGSVYDASIIYQMNILLDDDLVGALPGFEAGGASTLAGGGNLLWNEAGILNVGAADRFEAMAQPYRDAAAQLATGNKSAPQGVLGDPAFAGAGPLKVLYITGDIINLNVVKQTNVLGDSDQVTLAMNAAKAAPDAHWTVATGANTLVNFAQIADVDALGKTYVGGGAYSDDILIQAEFVSDRPAFDLGPRSADALVSEAVAFLGDDAGPGAHAPDLPVHPIAASADILSADPMQTMLA